MIRTLNFNKGLVTFGIPLSLFGVLIFLMRSSFIEQNDLMKLGISIDLLIVVPFIYFLLVRKSKIPNTTVIPVMIIGLLFVTYLLPQESQTYLTLFKTWILPIIEISIATFLFFKIRRAFKMFKRHKEDSIDFYTTIKSTCKEFLPEKFVSPFATELSVIYYGFISWKKRSIAENEFTYHKKSSAPTLFIAFILIIGIETVSVHVLLSRWNEIAAWVLTGLSIYTVIQVLGFAKSLTKRPISIDENSITLRYGILSEVDIPFSEIESVDLSKSSFEKDSSSKNLSPLGDAEGHNVVIHLKIEKKLVGLYGTKKKFETIGFHLDEPTLFNEKMQSVLIKQDHVYEN